MKSLLLGRRRFSFAIAGLFSFTWVGFAACSSRHSAIESDDGGWLSVGGDSGSSGALSTTGGSNADGGAASGDGGAELGVASGVVPLPADSNGSVSVPALGIHGAWYVYGDGVGSDGTTATGICEMLGMHLVSECSTITSPKIGSFTNVNSRMCTSGSVAKVIAGTVGCNPPATRCPDWRDIFGDGVGLDLNSDPRSATPLAYDAPSAGVIGVSFDIDALPVFGIRVEFPTVSTDITPAVWKPGTSDLSPLVVRHNVLLFADVASSPFLSPAVQFDPTTLTKILFHVPANEAVASEFSFCISNLAAITSM